MIAFVWNLFLALVWAAATERFTPSNLAIGFALGYVLLALMPPLPGEGAYALQMREMLDFFLFFGKEILVANAKVAAAVLSPASALRPGVIAVPLDPMSDLELTVLANMITLTPGTLTLDVSDDHRTLYVHAIDVRDAESFRRTVRDGYARRVVEILR